MGCVWRWVSVEAEVAVLEWVVLSECEYVRRGCSAAVCDVLCSVVVTAVSVYYYIRVGLRPPDVLQPLHRIHFITH